MVRWYTRIKIFNKNSITYVGIEPSECFPTWSAHLTNSASTCSYLADGRLGLAMTTTSVCPGTRILLRRNTSRISRFARLRLTAFPTRFEAVTPSRGPETDPDTQVTTRFAVEKRRPWRRTRRKSWRLRSLSARVNRRPSDRFDPRFESGSISRRIRHEAFAPLSPPGLDYTSATNGTHPTAETMCPLSTNIAGLVRSFHQTTSV